MFSVSGHPQATPLQKELLLTNNGAYVEKIWQILPQLAYYGPISITFIYGVTTLANIASAIKRARQNKKLRLHNASQRSCLRTYIKKVIKALDEKDITTAKAAYSEAVPVIDTMVNKNIIKKNKAARHKSRLHARIKALDLAQTA